MRGRLVSPVLPDTRLSLGKIEIVALQDEKFGSERSFRFCGLHAPKQTILDPENFGIPTALEGLDPMTRILDPCLSSCLPTQG